MNVRNQEAHCGSPAVAEANAASVTDVVVVSYIRTRPCPKKRLACSGPKCRCQALLAPQGKAYKDP